MNAVFLVTPNGAPPRSPAEYVELRYEPQFKTVLVHDWTVDQIRLTFESWFDPYNVVVTQEGDSFLVELVNYWGAKEVGEVTVYVNTTGCDVQVVMIQNGVPSEE